MNINLNINQVNTSQSISSSQKSTENEEKIKISNEILSKFFGKDKPGCNAAIIENGQTVYQASVGYADQQNHTLMTPNSAQHLGSLSKHVMAMCIFHLEKKGKLSLSDSIYKHLPHFPKFTYENKEVEITIDDLLKMQSGIPSTIPLIVLVAGMSDQDLTMKQKLEMIAADRELVFMPGTQEDYSNANYYLLEAIREKLTGESLANFADNVFFKDLRMTHTHFIDPNVKPDPNETIKGYTCLPATGKIKTDASGQPIERTTRNRTVGACGLISSINDLIIWDKFLQDYQKENNYFGISEKNADFQYVRGLRKATFGNFAITQHGGMIEGFSSQYSHIEHGDKKLSIILLSNADGTNLESAANELATVWLENQIPYPTLPSQTSKIHLEQPPGLRSDLQKFEGDYQCTFSNVNFRLEVQQQQLDPLHSVSQAKGKFFVLAFKHKTDANYPVRYFIPSERNIKFLLCDSLPCHMEIGKDGNSFELHFPNNTKKPLHFKKIESN